ncbi:MAG TPA: hypothetical protein VGK27_07345 [Candidatus Deferrimicrobiaceae bacterium]
MKILLVEDDENKRLQICNSLKESFPGCEITLAMSLQSGLRKIINSEVSIVLLDMTLPTYDQSFNEDGGRPQAYAGREILRQMDRRDIRSPVIVVTAYDRFGEGKDALNLEELDRELMAAHKDCYIGTVYYNPTIDIWKDQLNELIKTALSAE